MNRFLSLIVIACCAITGTQAIPAYPKRVKIVLENDSFYLYLRGDENCKYALTEDGYTALPDANGWMYASSVETGEVVKSAFPVCSEGKRSDEIKAFLSKQQKGVIPSLETPEGMVSRLSHQSPGTHRTSSVTGNRKVLIVLMQYSDVKFKKTQSDFDRLFNEQGYHDDGAYGSVYDYYNKVSYAQLQLQCDVLGPYTASRNMAYYGGNSGRNNNDSNPKALFNEAINFAIQEVNLADYDSDGDGYVDNVHIIFAGYGEEAGANANTIWSHEMTFRAERIGGMLIDRYSCSPELRGNAGQGISRIGAPCHEIGHALGAMDYYDVNYQAGGYYEGTGDWDIMASGSWNDDGARPADFNPYVKAYNFGWVEVQSLMIDTVNVIEPSTLPNQIYRIDTPVAGDYFLLDNRQSTGINSAEPGKGLLIFHIGPQIAQRAQTNTINATFPQQCYVVCASARAVRPTSSPTSYGSISSSGCPYPGTTGKTAFSKSTIPAPYCINGIYADFSLTRITQSQEGNISLYFSKEDLGGDTPPDEPTEEDDEIEGNIIWSDDFEIGSHFRFQSWTSETLYGKGSWQAKAYSNTPSSKEPTSVSGMRYMAMLANTGSTIMDGTSRYSCLTSSGSIFIPKGEYVLKGKYSGYSSQKISKDSLIVQVVSSDGSQLIAVKTLRIAKSLEWNTFSLSFTTSQDEDIKLLFTGIADEHSAIYLDKLQMYEPETNKIEVIDKDLNDSSVVYQLNGVRLGNLCDMNNSLKRGIYIVRDKGGKTYKVLPK